MQKTKKLKSEWCRKINRRDWKPCQNNKVCSVHFELECFRENLVMISKLNRPDLMPKKLHLKENAIPTLFSFKEKEDHRPIK